ncbi:MAG: hypothetical protein WCX46_04385, partial [Candidatus Paceibacterota bacterium]
LLIFANADTVFAGFFGGRIINGTKAMEIDILEMSGFQCMVFGTSIEIRPIGSPAITPTSYLIPWGTISDTKTTPATGQLIMGIYSGKTTVTCILKGIPPVTRIVILDTVKLFGTSQI